jgi:hypothetical protein
MSSTRFSRAIGSTFELVEEEEEEEDVEETADDVESELDFS